MKYSMCCSQRSQQICCLLFVKETTGKGGSKKLPQNTENTTVKLKTMREETATPDRDFYECCAFLKEKTPHVGKTD